MASKPPQHETPRAAAAYDAYAAMGPSRSLAKLFEATHQNGAKTGPTLNTLKEWSAAFDWQARVKEHDAAIAAEIEAAKLRAIEEMNARQAALGVEQTTAALAQIAALMADSRFGSQASVMLLKLAIETERTARGVPVSVQRQEVTGKDGGAIEHTVTDTRIALATRLAALTGQRPPDGLTGQSAE